MPTSTKRKSTSKPKKSPARKKPSKVTPAKTRTKSSLKAKTATKASKAKVKTKTKATKAKTATKATKAKAKAKTKATKDKVKTKTKATKDKVKTKTKATKAKVKTKTKATKPKTKTKATKAKAKTKDTKAKAKTKATKAETSDLKIKNTEKPDQPTIESSVPLTRSDTPPPKPRVSKIAAQTIPKKLAYTIGDYVVYPSHGVGQVTEIEDHKVGEMSLKVFVVVFDKEKMTLRVPVDKTNASGMRKISTHEKMDSALTTLKGKARQRRVMWSRRAQEYEAKLNSGDPIAIAEVIRDLFRNEEQPDQSYSERQMYEAALERLAREYAALKNTDTEDAIETLEGVLKAA